MVLEAKPIINLDPIPSGTLEKPVKHWACRCRIHCEPLAIEMTHQVPFAGFSPLAPIQIVKEFLLLIEVQSHEGVQTNQLMLNLVSRCGRWGGTEVATHTRQ